MAGGFTLRPAVREQVGALVALAGPSGCGKTYSAIRLARGMVDDPSKVAVLDSEARRALHYASRFKPPFLHGDLAPPFRPTTYLEAIEAAVDAGAQAVVVDSMSHEWAGAGGVLDWHEDELTRMAGTDYARREACKFAAWIKPKQAHKRLVNRILQFRVPLIFCLRAERKTKMVKVQKGNRTVNEPVDMGYQPIIGGDFAYEMTVLLNLTAENPGMVPEGEHKVTEELREAFAPGAMLTEEVGAKVRAWAMGGQAPAAVPSNLAVTLPDGKVWRAKDWPTFETWWRRTLEAAKGAGKLQDFAALLHANRTVFYDAEEGEKAGNLLDFLLNEAPEVAPADGGAA